MSTNSIKKADEQYREAVKARDAAEWAYVAAHNEFKTNPTGMQKSGETTTGNLYALTMAARGFSGAARYAETRLKALQALTKETA